MIWGNVSHLSGNMTFQFKSNSHLIKYMRDSGVQNVLLVCNKPSIIRRVVSKQLSPSCGPHQRRLIAWLSYREAASKAGNWMSPSSGKMQGTKRACKHQGTGVFFFCSSQLRIWNIPGCLQNWQQKRLTSCKRMERVYLKGHTLSCPRDSSGSCEGLCPPWPLLAWGRAAASQC